MQCLIQFINFLDKHSGSLTFLVTAVYVIATILICRANIKSANATKEQIEETRRQFEENNRAFVTVTFDVIRSGLLVLCIENHGKRIASNVNIAVSEEFIQNITDVSDKEHIRELCKASFTLGIGRSWYVGLGNHMQLDELSKAPLAVAISYEDSRSHYREQTSIDLKQYFWVLLYDSPTEDAYQEMRKQTKELEKFQKELHQLVISRKERNTNA